MIETTLFVLMVAATAMTLGLAAVTGLAAVGIGPAVVLERVELTVFLTAVLVAAGCATIGGWTAHGVFDRDASASAFAYAAACGGAACATIAASARAAQPTGRVWAITLGGLLAFALGLGAPT